MSDLCSLTLLAPFCAGFEKKQAELIVSALVTLTTANMDIVYRDMVTGAHQVKNLTRKRCKPTQITVWIFFTGVSVAGDCSPANYGSSGFH